MKRGERVFQIWLNVLRFNIGAAEKKKFPSGTIIMRSDLHTILSRPDLYIQVPAHSQTRLKLLLLRSRVYPWKSLYLWLGLCVVNFFWNLCFPSDVVVKTAVWDFLAKETDNRDRWPNDDLSVLCYSASGCTVSNALMCLVTGENHSGFGGGHARWT